MLANVFPLPCDWDFPRHQREQCACNEQGEDELTHL